MENLNQTDELGRKQGKWIYYYQNKDVNYIAHYLDGKLNGEFFAYRTNGNLFYKTNYFIK
jgi:antitoxin component YwqK of YwqJK toxin-antitoxin module